MSVCVCVAGAERHCKAWSWCTA